MTFLGTYTITPNSKTIEVDCYGTLYPVQKENLEQEGFNSYAELEEVKHSSIYIIDYLSDDLIELLTSLINSK